jgi:hypothetical protein
MMNPKSSYRVDRVAKDFTLPGAPFFWKDVPSLSINHYLWRNNGYQPEVEARLVYSDRFLYVFFKVFETHVRIRHTEFQSPVYKDSCVEFFIDPFPAKKIGYMNFETNAVGTLLLGFGPDRENRRRLAETEITGFEIVPSIRKPVDGACGSDFWTLHYRIPQTLFEALYGEKIVSGTESKANFYKCGDETEFEHYGVWCPIDLPAPDFHVPRFFGDIHFK